jgi:hypothetical protein
MVDGVDADYRVDRRVRHRKRESCISLPEGRKRAQPLPACHGVRAGDGVGITVDAEDLRARGDGKVQRRSAGTTPDVEGTGALTKRSPADDFAPFVRRQPAVLTEVLAVGVEPHPLAGVELEPCIRTVVQARRRSS